MAFTISSLSATPAFETSNKFNIVAPVNVPFVVWTPETQQSVIDGEGSSNPVTFRIPSKPATTYEVPIVLTGTCTFSSPGSYSVVGSLLDVNGTLQPVITSATLPIPPSTGPTDPTPIVVRNFTINAPFLKIICMVPFRYAGDFKWKVVANGQAAGLLGPTTRLELCWAQARASAGPAWIGDPQFTTQVNFGGIYPIGLLRWFFPQPSEFPDETQFWSDYRRWYIERAMTKIWRWGNSDVLGGYSPVQGRPQYDTTNGASQYGIGSCGGSFRLADWLAASRKTLNCYDLAGITQLACALLVDKTGFEAVASNWVLQDPNCYILPGVLYGRGDVSLPIGAPGLNNPFFASNKSPAYLASTSLFKGTRTPFFRHTWIEVSLNVGSYSRTVLDATLAVADPTDPTGPKVLEVGRRSRSEYEQAHRDRQIEQVAGHRLPGNLTNYLSGTPNPQGSCYTNNDCTYNYIYTLSQPPGGVQRVGVYDTYGLTGPLYLNHIVLNMAFFRPEVAAAITRGTNPHPPEKSFNNASLSTPNLAPLVTAMHPNIRHVSSDVHLTSGISRQTMTFDDVPYTATETGKLFLTIKAFNNYEHPISAMANDLMRYERPLEDVALAVYPPIGALALKNSSSISWVRGNHFVQLSLEGSSNPNTEIAIDIESLARQINSYLQSETVKPGEHHKPSLQLNAPVPTRVRVGDRFFLALSDNKRNHTRAEALTNDSSVILPRGPAETNGVFTFYAQKPGKAEITLVVAHADTLHPGFETHEIEVVE